MRVPHIASRRRNEDGYVAITTAILLIVLIGALALALDLGVSRTRASELQRIADAAALAAAAGLPDLARAQTLANESLLRNDPSGKAIVTVNTVPDSPGKVEARATDAKVTAKFAKRTDSLSRVAYAEQAVGIPMGTPFNSIGTGDLPGFIPGSPSQKQGYFLAINGPCTAKEDGDRFMSMFDGIRGSLADTSGKNSDAYHCADYDADGHLWNQGADANFTATAQSQWRNNTEYRAGGYSYIVDVPCDGGVTPCPRGTPISTPVYVDVWDPYFLAWQGQAPCTSSTDLTPTCLVDKVPIANPEKNWNSVGLAVNFATTHFKIFEELSDAVFSATPIASESFGSADVKWYTDNGVAAASWNCNWDGATQVSPSAPYCKNWFPIGGSAISRSGRYRVQVAADPAIPPSPPGGLRGLQVNGVGWKWDGGRSFSINTYALRVRRSLSATSGTFTACSKELDASCATITGEGVLSVYVRTPGTADLFLSKMAPASQYRGRTIQIQLFDPGEGASRIKILMPTGDPTNPYRSVPFTYSTADPGLAAYTNGTVVQDRAIGWTGSDRTPVAVAGADGIDVSGTYASSSPPWPTSERYSQFKFNGRLLALDVTVPNDYGKDSGGADLDPASMQGGWWKVRYESSGAVEDRTTWVVTSGDGPLRLARS